MPILGRKPGALSNGSPFKDWKLFGVLGLMRVRIACRGDSDRRVVGILSAVQEGGLEAWRRPAQKLGDDVTVAVTQPIDDGAPEWAVHQHSVKEDHRRPGAA